MEPVVFFSSHVDPGHRPSRPKDLARGFLLFIAYITDADVFCTRGTYCTSVYRRDESLICGFPAGFSYFPRKVHSPPRSVTLGSRYKLELNVKPGADVCLGPEVALVSLN